MWEKADAVGNAQRCPQHACRCGASRIFHKSTALPRASTGLGRGDFSHECMDIKVNHGISGECVARLLDRTAIFRCYPAAMRIDNGSEFTSRAVIAWTQEHRVRHLLIEPGRQCGHIIAIASERLSANAMLVRLDAMGFAVSAGSACSSGTLKPSRVLAAYGIDPALARNTIRVSLGWNTTPDDLASFADAWEALHA